MIFGSKSFFIVFRGIPVGTIPVFTAESRLRINHKLASERGVKIEERLLLQAKVYYTLTIYLVIDILNREGSFGVIE